MPIDSSVPPIAVVATTRILIIFQCSPLASIDVVSIIYNDVFIRIIYYLHLLGLFISSYLQSKEQVQIEQTQKHCAIGRLHFSVYCIMIRQTWIMFYVKIVFPFALSLYQLCYAPQKKYSEGAHQSIYVSSHQIEIGEYEECTAQ